MSKTEDRPALPDALRLSPVSYVVMGLIRLRGPSTPYDLKRAVGRSIQYFWPFPHSQLYGEPDRLANAGLLRQEQESDGRRRKVYSLTKAGEDALADWLGKLPDHIFELRDMAILQLFFSDFMHPEHLGEMAKDQVRFHEERIAAFEEIADRSREYAGQHRMFPLELGIRLSRTCADYWAGIAKQTSE